MGFLQDLTGSSARKALRNAKAQADQQLQAGYDQAQPYYNQAYDLYTPYAQSGGQANQLYADTLGLNGADAQKTAESTYFNDPVQQQILNDKSNALLRQLNARGDTYGARAALAGNRVALQNFGDWQSKLQGFGQQGLAATGAQSAIRSGQGDLRYALGTTQAGNEINYGNARAQASNIGINNLLGIAKVATSFAGLPGVLGK